MKLHHFALSIEYKPVGELRPIERNARTHSKDQIRQIADSIRVFGFTNPILVDQNNQIVAGHGRTEAAKMLGMDQVPTIRLDRLTPDQIRAYVLADNKLAENAGWDKSILAIEFQYLNTLDCSDFDVTITGSEIAEIDVILGEGADQDQVEDPVPEPLHGEPITQPGDLWILGKHRIICGNSLNDSTYKTLMGTVLERDGNSVILSSSARGAIDQDRRPLFIGLYG